MENKSLHNAKPSALTPYLVALLICLAVMAVSYFALTALYAVLFEVPLSLDGRAALLTGAGLSSANFWGGLFKVAPWRATMISFLVAMSITFFGVAAFL